MNQYVTKRYLNNEPPRGKTTGNYKLRAFNQPTMIIWSVNDKFLPVFWGERLFRGIQGACRFELVPSAGHLLPEEKPEVLTDYLFGFLNSAN